MGESSGKVLEKQNKKKVPVPYKKKNSSIQDKINQFNSPESRKYSILSHDSGVSSAALTTSASSFGSSFTGRSISLTSNSESEDHKSFSRRKSRSSSSHSVTRDGRRSSYLRSISVTSMELNNSIRSTSTGRIERGAQEWSTRMERGAQKERLKLEKLINGSFMKSMIPKRSRSQDNILSTRAVKNELKTIEDQERARAVVRKEKLNKKRWQSEPRSVSKINEKIIQNSTDYTEKSRYEVDQTKKEIRLTL